MHINPNITINFENAANQYNNVYNAIAKDLNKNLQNYSNLLEID